MHKEMTFWLVLSLVIHIATLTAIDILNQKHFIRISSPGPIQFALIEPRPQKKAAVKKTRKHPVKIHKQRIIKTIPRSKVVVRKQRIVRRIKKGRIPTKNPREEQLEKALERIKKKVEKREAAPQKTAPAPGGGGTMGEKNIYFSVVRNKVMQSWVIPENLIEDVYSLEAIVTFTIYADGHISDVNLEESSGNRYFDESVLRAIRKAAPFPPLPTSINKKSIEIGIRFRPEEKDLEGLRQSSEFLV
jgi:TonB family protein